MRIKDNAILILQDIYDLSTDNQMNQVEIAVEELAEKRKITTIFAFKCLTYLFGKGLLIGKSGSGISYGKTPITIQITASGIDLVEH